MRFYVTFTVLLSLSATACAQEPTDSTSTPVISAGDGMQRRGHLVVENGSIVQVHFGRVPIGDAELEFLSQLPDLWYVDLNYTNVTGEGLKHVAAPEKFTCLDLFGAALNDEGLAQVSRFRNLEHLRVDNTQITNEGLQYISVLTELTVLDVKDNRIGDAALEPIAGLPNLRSLSLQLTHVTDLGLKTDRPDAQFAATEPCGHAHQR